MKNIQWNKILQLSLSSPNLQLNPIVAFDILKQEENIHTSSLKDDRTDLKARMQQSVWYSLHLNIREQNHG